MHSSCTSTTLFLFSEKTFLYFCTSDLHWLHLCLHHLQCVNVWQVWEDFSSAHFHVNDLNFKKSALFLLVVFHLSLFMIDTNNVIEAWFQIVRLLMFDRHFHYFDEWSFLNFAAFHRCRMIVAKISTDEHCC